MKTFLVGTDENGIETYAIVNKWGTRLELINYGARIFKLFVRNREKKLIDVVTGFETPGEYLQKNPYFGATVGRVANRIGGASFEYYGKVYELAKNNGENSLHGGLVGFDKKMWKATINNTKSITFKYTSPDGEEGYPGNLKVSVTYALSDIADGKVTITYRAKSDKKTPVNLTNHTYFNLSGDFSNSVKDTYVKIHASNVSVIDEQLIPNGEKYPVKGTPYDFTDYKRIGKDIAKDDIFLNYGGGYDLNYILDTHSFVPPIASAYNPKSGIKMDVRTTAPCMQFYTGNNLHAVQGRQKYNKYSAFCMETQYHPNAVNLKNVPSIYIGGNKQYFSRTEYLFYVPEQI